MTLSFQNQLKSCKKLVELRWRKEIKLKFKKDVSVKRKSKQMKLKLMNKKLRKWLSLQIAKKNLMIQLIKTA